ncbi:CoA:oxalate CoA-transferase [Asaia sp. W19]|uniref:CoA:oxalate CoA-transferase n=1 Tax=unclassified Asaia TaxID=2685023 RepID=UPI000F8ECB85|nr:CoA:oxalate CoA-transferase [Asaia sp. W19]RUT26378.1 CoA:oxalate CoA-transferase [Asaia sp. W19]
MSADKTPAQVPMHRATGPFEGLLVIDLTHVLNGPFGTTILTDLGARTIKVEAPGHGDDTRTYGPYVGERSLYFSFVNRGKESIVLNLKDEQDRAVFLEMVKRADVLCENYRPGVMDRLGFSYEALSALNPRLVYASSSGFGHTGPLAHAPAYDTIVQAMSGMMEATGFPDGPPTRVGGTSLSDLCGGTFMFCGIASALYARERTGKGAHVDVSMFDGTFAFLQHALMNWSATGQAGPRIGNRHPSMAPFDVYRTKDSHIVICCGNNHLFTELCATLGIAGIATDPRFIDNSDRMTNLDALKSVLEQALMQQDSAYWLEALAKAGVPVGPMLSVAEAAALPQTAARNMVIDAGGLKMPGNPVKISGYDDPLVRAGAPALDEHATSLRAEFAPPQKAPS